MWFLGGILSGGRDMCALSLRVCLGNLLDDELDAPDGSVVARDRVRDEREIAIGTREPDDRDAELLRLLHRRALVARIDHEECRREICHLHKSAETVQELIDLTVDEKTLALGVFPQLARFALAHELFKSVDALAYVLEIRERSPDPSTRHVGCPNALSRFFHERDSLVLTAHKKHVGTLLCHRADKFNCRGEAPTCFLKVEDVGAVLGAKEVGGGCGVSACATEPEMRSRIKKRLYGSLRHRMWR